MQEIDAITASETKNLIPPIEQPAEQPGSQPPGIAPTAQLRLQINVRSKVVIFTVNDLHIGMTVKETLNLATELRNAANKLGQMLFDVERLKNKKPSRK